MMARLLKHKISVISLTIILSLALVAQHFSRNSFDYVRIVMRVIKGTTMDLGGRSIEVPKECYRASEAGARTIFALGCKSGTKTYLGINVRKTDQSLEHLRVNLADYPHADIRDEFIYFAWGRPGEEFVGVIDHYLILPSMQLSVSGDDRDLVLRLARDISNHEIRIDPIDFGL